MSTEADAAGHAYSETIVRQLVHEDGLLVNRLAWLVASQSFLFTAYAIMLNASPPARNAVLEARQDQLLRIIPALGMATCGLIYLGVLAGVRVTVTLRRELRNERCAGPASMRPPIQGTATTYALGLAAPLLLPPLFFAAWALLLGH
jgi:hypothetical protein